MGCAPTRGRHPWVRYPGGISELSAIPPGSIAFPHPNPGCASRPRANGSHPSGMKTPATTGLRASKLASRAHNDRISRIDGKFIRYEPSAGASRVGNHRFVWTGSPVGDRTCPQCSTSHHRTGITGEGDFAVGRLSSGGDEKTARWGQRAYHRDQSHRKRLSARRALGLPPSPAAWALWGRGGRGRPRSREGRSFLPLP